MERVSHSYIRAQRNASLLDRGSDLQRTLAGKDDGIFSMCTGDRSCSRDKLPAGTFDGATILRRPDCRQYDNDKQGCRGVKNMNEQSLCYYRRGCVDQYGRNGKKEQLHWDAMMEKCKSDGLTYISKTTGREYPKQTKCKTRSL